jgi:hypothetical protein
LKDKMPDPPANAAGTAANAQDERPPLWQTMVQIAFFMVVFNVFMGMYIIPPVSLQYCNILISALRYLAGRCAGRGSRPSQAALDAGAGAGDGTPAWNGQYTNMLKVGDAISLDLYVTESSVWDPEAAPAPLWSHSTVFGGTRCTAQQPS